MKVHDLDLKAQSITLMFQRNNLILLFQTNDRLWCYFSNQGYDACVLQTVCQILGGYELGYWEWKIHQKFSTNKEAQLKIEEIQRK